MGGRLDLAAAALVREAAIDVGVVSAGHRVHPAAVALVVVFAIFTALIPSVVVAVVAVAVSAQRVTHRRARREEVSVDVEPDALRDDAVVEERELFGAQRLQGRSVVVVVVVIVFGIIVGVVVVVKVEVVVVVAGEGAQRVRHHRARREEVSVDVKLDALRDDDVMEDGELFIAHRLQRRGVGVVVVVVGKAATEAHVRKLVRLVSQAAKAAPVVERRVLGDSELRKLGGVVVKRQVAHRKVVRSGEECA